MIDHLKYLIVGCGFFGAVLAERIASRLRQKVLVIDRKAHIGGNSYAEIDRESGIERHCYGSHIFHTNEPEVAAYLRNFCTLNHYRHQVLIRTQGKFCFMPINLKTINEFFGLALSPAEAEDLLRRQAGDAAGARNLREKAIALIGPELYHAFIEGYTAKQWGCAPEMLPAEIITRLPVRFNYNTDYFDALEQGIPAAGYAELFRKILDHPDIELQLNTSYDQIRSAVPADCRIIYTGMPDELFDYACGDLEYRSLRFEEERLELRDFQGTSVVNYGDPEIPYTRIHEFKHYHPEWREAFHAGQTIIMREYPQSYRRGAEAYYPVGNERNRSIYLKYAELAERRKIILGGRLGRYCYWDMDQSIKHALECFRKIENESV